MSDIEQRVKKIIGEQLGVKQEEVVNVASFVEDLGADEPDRGKYSEAVTRGKIA